MSSPRLLFAKTRLRHLLLLLLAAFGIVPIVFTTIANLRINRDLVEREEQLNLSRQVEQLSDRIAMQLDSVQKQLGLLRAGWQELPARAQREQLVQSFLRGARPDYQLRIVDPSSGVAFQPDLAPAVIGIAESARLEGRRFAIAPEEGGELWLVVSDHAGAPDELSLQAIVPLQFETVSGQEMFVLDRQSGRVLWGAPSRAEPVWDAVERSADVAGYLQFSDRTNSVFEYQLRVGARTRTMLGRFAPLGGTDWALLVQRPKAAALTVFRRLVDNAALIGALTVLLALVFGALASNLISRPIQTLAETSHEIASGHFGERVAVNGFGLEISELAESFNTMSAHVESQVARLRRAAQVNRDLFLGTLRVMLAAIEAKEPYTAGHSERVASYSRAIGNVLSTEGGGRTGLKEEAWTAGLLHDIGKIGIEDRILNKGDVLTSEEFEEMKRHPVIGADILAPIEPLRPIIPAIRYHHERWQGGGYPEGLSGEEIPLLARIVAVADTFDALTTQRVYQAPYTHEQALQIIRQLRGRGFDPVVADAFFAAYEHQEIRVSQAPTATLTNVPVETVAAVHT